ncbi:unnamed protein product [Absidia cylindrospora]
MNSEDNTQNSISAGDNAVEQMNMESEVNSNAEVEVSIPKPDEPNEQKQAMDMDENTTIKDMKAEIHRAQYRIKTLYGDYQRCKQNGTPEQLKVIEKQLDDMKREREINEAFFKLLIVESEEPTIRSKISFKDIPLFQLKEQFVYDSRQRTFETVGAFLNTFEKILVSEQVDMDKHWCRWLNCAMNEEHQAWFNQNLMNKDYSWAEARKVFETRFESVVYKLFMGVKAVTMEMEAHESVLAFGDRLIKAMHEGEVEDGQALAYRFLGCLPMEVANAVGAAWAGQSQTLGISLPTRVHQLVDIARTITLPMDVKKKQDSHPFKSSSRWTNGIKKDKQMAKSCYFCHKPWAPGHRCAQHDKAKGISKARALKRPRKSQEIDDEAQKGS